MSVMLIVERNLHSEMGHHPGQIRSIAAFSSADDIHVVTWKGLKQLPVLALPSNRREHLKVHYVLETSSAVKEIADVESLTVSEAQTLAQIVSKSGAARDDVIVVPSASAHDLRVAITLAETDGPKIILRIIALGVLYELSEEHRDAVRKFQVDGRIHLSCETEEMQDAVRSQYNIACHCDFILPCNILPDDGVSENLRGASFRVGMLGGQRREKGSLRLGSFVRAIATQSRKISSPPKVTLVVQTTPKKKPMRTLITLKILLWAKILPGYPNVEILWGAQSSKDFHSVLCGLDCVLLPYELDRYTTSGSGMIIDAVNAALPVIRTRGMAMAKCLSFGNGIEATSDDEFARAILDMATNPAPYNAATQQARIAMHARYAELPFRPSSEFLAPKGA